MIKESKRKIMTYPFTGLDYSDIKKIGDRIVFDDDQLLFLTSSVDEKYGMKTVKSDVINDKKLKSVLCYFYFLNDLCRKYHNSHYLKCSSADFSIPSFNTYIDTVLITINEIVSICKYNDSKLCLSNFFSSSLNSDCLSSVFDLLIDDSYITCVSKYRDNGVVFNKIMDGNLNLLVSSIVNTNDILSVDSGVESAPVLLKKVSRNRVI